MDDKIKAIISVGGKWHAFDLAEQLEKRGLLKRLITSYPKFKTREYNIPDIKVKSIVIKEILTRAYGRLPLYIRNIFDPQFFIHNTYDKIVALCLVNDANLIITWSSYGLYTMRKAKKMGMLTILEHGSSHIIYQNEILKQEYARWGIHGELAHPKIIKKELKEYDESNYIAIPSLFVKRTFLEQGIPETKLLHIPYGINLSNFKPIQKIDSIFRIVSVGNLTLRKGFHYLLQAFFELNLENSELALYGPISKEIEPFLKKYYKKNLIISQVPHKELYKYYSQGSIFVLASIEEGLARVLFEAMACGLPIIATTNTGGQDIIENDKEGYIIPICDIDAIKEKIIYLYKNQEISSEMGQRARRKVLSEYSLENYGDKITEVYQSIFKLKNSKDHE